MIRPETQRLITLDGMRGLAALIVVLHHAEVLAPIAASGYLAVDFFFLLSGVVISKAYVGRLENGLSVSGFVRERLIRIYPIFFIGLMLGIIRRIAQVATHHPHAMPLYDVMVATLFNALMLPAPVSGVGGALSPINVPSWSLFFELYVNIFWVLFLVKLSRRRLFLFVAAFGLVTGIAFLNFGSTNGGPTWQTIHFGVLRSLFGFGLGVLISKYLPTQAPKRSAFTFLPCLALCLVLLSRPSEAIRPLFDVIMVFCVFPVIVWLGASFDPPLRAVPATRLLGEISYPLYILHYAPLFITGFAAQKLGIPAFAWVPVFIFVMCAVCLYLSRTYDVFVRRWLTAKLKERANGTTPTSAA